MSDEDSKFSAIIKEAIEKAERIDCPFHEFVDGLKEMHDELQDRYQSAKSELAQREEDE